MLRKIREEGPAAKAIVFVQWRDIEQRVAVALREAKVTQKDATNGGQNRSKTFPKRIQKTMPG